MDVKEEVITSVAIEKVKKDKPTVITVFGMRFIYDPITEEQIRRKEKR